MAAAWQRGARQPISLVRGARPARPQAATAPPAAGAPSVLQAVVRGRNAARRGRWRAAAVAAAIVAAAALVLRE